MLVQHNQVAVVYRLLSRETKQCGPAAVVAGARKLRLSRDRRRNRRNVVGQFQQFTGWTIELDRLDLIA